MLSLQHLTVTRGTRVALRDVSLDVEPTDILCILGEEGSGKTTLLKLLTRELQPQEGVIKIDGAILSQLPKEVLRMYRARIGYLDETAFLDASLTIAGNIALPLDLQGRAAPERDRAVADLLKRFHLTGVATQKPNVVSRGERQLAAIARTIAAGPLIVLLDEPFQGLSDDACRLAAGLLQNMQKKGATMIIASAQERTASFFASPRIVRLQRGKVLDEEVALPQTPTARVREAASAATSDLIEKTTTTIAPTPVEQVEQVETNEKKRIRITAVGSL